LHFGPLLADFGFPPNPDPHDPAVADGYWLWLEPLSAGEHELHFHAENPDPENPDLKGYRPDCCKNML
jgi:hypothetical protein